MNAFVDSGNPIPSFPFLLVLCLFLCRKLHFILKKIHKNCCHQSCSFWLKYVSNLLSVGASPQTPLGERDSALPDPLAVFRGPTSKGEGRGEEKGGGGRRGEGREVRAAEERGDREFALSPRKQEVKVI